MGRPEIIPPLSVAMSVYNAERFLAEAIESVLAQTFSDFEFLILDDGSTDGSRKIIEHYARRDPRIRMIARENRGLIISLNQLLDEARAPLVARMDADDICLPERFAKQIAFLESNPDHGVIGCWTTDIGEKGEPYPLAGADHPDTHEGFLAAIERREPLLCHPAVMFRLDMVRSVGGYHAAFRHCEDLDLWLRLAGITRLCNLPERLFRYRHYEQQVSSRHATEQQVGAAVSRLAYRERREGRPDPTEKLTVLPPIDALDALFAREGIARSVRTQVAPGLLYSKAGLQDHGFEVLVRHLREGGAHAGMWRTVARLVRFGKPMRAARLALTLATTTAQAQRV
ncbi:glycosyltransferase [Novosphingobium sp. Chol11]|uniref:glycosyltransferase n=1 Tax=Novosphingobium sp. Chol11 TaxID=1385763 RepID=UPI0025DF1178|nr:glycosyltransferase [Novosphingobium sp. Chol11]